jgi:hypothetical protein
MSVQAMTWVFERSDSNGNARLVLLSIANHADREGANAWPSLETIAVESRCSTATVKRAIAELRSIGELHWRRGLGQAGAFRKSNLYWLPLMRIQAGLPRDPAMAQSEPSGSGDGSSRHGQRLKRASSNGSPVSQEPSLNRPEPVGASAESQAEVLTDKGRAIARAVVEFAKQKAMQRD